MKTITEALYADHVVVLRDLNRALANPNLVPSLYPAIANNLRRHDSAEKATLYKALLSYPIEVPDIERSEAEHEQIGALLDRMDHVAYSDPRFQLDLRELSRRLDAHLALEQSRVFTAARSLLPIARQYQLAQRYEIKMGRGRVTNISLVRPTLGRPRRNPSVVMTAPIEITTPAKRQAWWKHFVGTWAVFHKEQ